MTSRFRPAAAPEAGARLAMSFAVSLVVAITAGLIGSALVDLTLRTVCGIDPSVPCFAKLMVVFLGGLFVAAHVLSAWWFRLGWEWAIANVALVLILVEIVGNPWSSWLLLIVLIPGVSAAVTDPSLPWLQWRRIGVVVATVASFAYLGYVIWDLVISS